MGRATPLDFLSYQLRKIDVELSAALTFRMSEVLFQQRPNHWARIWPSAVALSQWLLEQTPGALPASAKELGCGLGLVSMTLAHLGIAVEGSDREPAALAFTARNAQANGLTGVSLTLLDWAEPEGAPTGLIVASDILYEQDAETRVFDLIHLSGLLAPHGRLLAAGPAVRARPAGVLVGMLRDVGYSHYTDVRVVEWEGRREDIDIHVLGRPASQQPGD